MTPVHQITMLKFIKNLSSLPSTVETLHSADALDYLIELLSHSLRKNQQHFREIVNQVLNTMFNICRLSKERQESAATHGIVPLLLKIMQIDRPPKEFALPILCDMAHSGNKGRRSLWQHKGLDFYVSLLADQYWQTTALDAIYVWLQEETAKVEMHLLNGNFTSAIQSCFTVIKGNAFASFDPTLLEPLLKLLRTSPALVSSLAKPEMYLGIAAKLAHKKPVVRLNLLRLVRTILDGSEPDLGISSVGGGAHLQALFEVIQTLERDSAVLVRNLAHEIAKKHIEGDYFEVKSIGTGSNNSHGSRSSGSNGSRRAATRYITPPSRSLGAPVTTQPMTPTRPGHRHAESESVIHQIHTPRRSQIMQQDAHYQRPRSRDGGLAPVVSIPRRSSGDTLAQGQGPPPGTPGTPGRSRLPRGSVSYTRPSSSGVPPAPPLHHGRSDSSLSSKETSAASSAAAARMYAMGGSAAVSSVDLLDTPRSPALVRERDRQPAAAFKRRGSRVPSSEIKYVNGNGNGNANGSASSLESNKWS